MILNMHLTSDIMSQNDLKVRRWLCFKDHKKQHHFYLVKNSSINSNSFSVHISLHANELCWPRPSLPWKSKRD